MLCGLFKFKNIFFLLKYKFVDIFCDFISNLLLILLCDRINVKLKIGHDRLEWAVCLEDAWRQFSFWKFCVWACKIDENLFREFDTFSKRWNERVFWLSSHQILELQMNQIIRFKTQNYFHMCKHTISTPQKYPEAPHRDLKKKWKLDWRNEIIPISKDLLLKVRFEKSKNHMARKYLSKIHKKIP